MSPDDYQWLQRMLPPSLFQEVEAALLLVKVAKGCPRVCAYMDYTDEGWPFMCGMAEDEEVHHPEHGHVPEMVHLVP